tara:strand:+ start:88 stop:261 length:174 start_codon:yes stop_codon:yes gene_type:complete
VFCVPYKTFAHAVDVGLTEAAFRLFMVFDAKDLVGRYVDGIEVLRGCYPVHDLPFIL